MTADNTRRLQIHYTAKHDKLNWAELEPGYKGAWSANAAILPAV
jgi:hypothetical protein